LRIGKTAAKAIIECVKAIGYLSSYSTNPITSEKVHHYLRMSFDYTNDAIEAAVLLQFINGIATLSLTPSGQDLCDSSSSQSKILFKRQLLNFPPFTPLIRLILDGNDFENSVRKICIIYGLEGNEKEIAYSLRSWLRYANIIGSKGEYLGDPLDLSLPVEYISDLKDALSQL